jgi:hypothetical protein
LAGVVLEQTVPVLLGTEAGRTPPKKDDPIGTTGYLLVGPESQLARPGHNANDIPAARPGLLLHHPEWLSLEPVHSRRTKGRAAGVNFGSERPLRARVVIPAHEVKVASQVVVVDCLITEAHKIVGD